MSMLMFVFTTWIYPIPWVSFGFMILVLLGSIIGLVIDWILPLLNSKKNLY